MKKSWYYFIVLFLLTANIICWRQVFVLSEENLLKVDFFSVGQGDSEFITTPQGHQILIDGGPNSVVLEKLAERMPFFDKTIDVVILTHPEKDHMTGILEVLEKYKVDYFLWTGVVKDNAENKKLAVLLKEISRPKNSFLASLSGDYSTNVATLSVGDKIKVGNVVVDIFSPADDVNGTQPKDVNETSVVAKLVYGRNSFLFVGDIGFNTEKQLTGLKADVLKVAHHGSKYSTGELFLENVEPEYAVIEVGKNSYGHPTPETLQRLEKFGIKTFNTYTDGDITMLSDGNKIYLK